MPTPAEQLIGLTLEGGWDVVEPMAKGPEATGGYFSQGYKVRNKEGRTAYLKALDFSRAMAGRNPAGLLKEMTTAFEYERDICLHCKVNKLSRVVTAIGDGVVYTDMANPLTAVQYLIFELADGGDIRKHLDLLGYLDLAWVLRCLQNAATGTRQLHGVGIFHQDLKPSNVLVFSGEGSKIGDLGRSCSKTISAPHASLVFTGDMGYAPPEALYGYADADTNQRRAAADMYLFGSLVVFFFLRVGATSAILLNIDPAYSDWRRYSGTFEQALPFVRDAFDIVLRGFAMEVPEPIREAMVLMVRQLCEPDPRLRGHPEERGGHTNPYSLERYISQLDLLARRAELALFRKK